MTQQAVTGEEPENVGHKRWVKNSVQSQNTFTSFWVNFGFISTESELIVERQTKTVDEFYLVYVKFQGNSARLSSV